MMSSMEDLGIDESTKTYDSDIIQKDDEIKWSWFEYPIIEFV